MEMVPAWVALEAMAAASAEAVAVDAAALMAVWTIPAGAIWEIRMTKMKGIWKTVTDGKMATTLIEARCQEVKCQTARCQEVKCQMIKRREVRCPT